MATGQLTVNLGAVQRNWKSLDVRSAASTQTAAVVKADGYGLGASHVAKALKAAGAENFFVAAAEEGAAVREAVGDANIYVFSGYMQNDASLFAKHQLIPLLNSPQQLQAWKTAQGNRAFGLQLDTGMNRLGFEPDEFRAIDSDANDSCLFISHLACADEPRHPMNRQQLDCFRQMTDSLAANHGVQRSLAATGGTLLGPEFHFDMVRPGIGLYGGLPYAQAEPVVTLSLPLIQTRKVLAGETVGYGAAWKATKITTVATLAAGYADGIIRAVGNVAAAVDSAAIAAAGGANKDRPAPNADARLSVYAGEIACPIIGRVSMDMLTVDISALGEVPAKLELLNGLQSVDQVAAAAGTIGYEILTACGQRYQRCYVHS